MSQGIQFNRLILKNFLSFGPRPTEIDLRGDYITVVLGINHDTGGDESRNGVGKSALIDALAYCLYGKTFRNISNQKLVNKMARKGQGMLVVVEFDTSEGSYRIERGEAPARLKLFRKDLDNDDEFLARDGKSFKYDITRSKGETTDQIEQIIGFDLKLFEFLIANSSETDAFMKLPEDKKREIAERLMGLNRLTERAEELKEERKDAKKDLVAQESALEATQRANERIQAQIVDLESKEKAWEDQHKKRIEQLRKSIEEMKEIDTEEQIEILKLIDQLETEHTRVNSERKQAEMELNQAKRELSDLRKKIEETSARFQELGRQKEKLEQSTCPTCEQHWVADPKVLEKVQQEIDEIGDFSEQAVELTEQAESEVTRAETRIADIDKEAEELSATAEEIGDFNLVFESVEEASAAGAVLKSYIQELEQLENEENPHTGSIQGLRESALQKIDDSEVQNLRKTIRHYTYLIDLLQNKDSFLRKAVIDRWLPKLNGRIANYLTILELPFVVRIENDLGMSITDFGEDFDWGNLSKGQRQRVSIALNLAFQDLFEATNHPLSLLMIDELIDSGICNRGATQTVQALRDMSAEKKKRIFLITHRTDIADQIEDVMLIELKNRISRIDEDDEDESMEAA